jgi:thiol:disulfide interchange protein DsbD
MTPRRTPIAVAATAVAAGLALAGAPPKATDLVKTEVVVIEPIANGKSEIAVVYRIEPKWHIYWMNPGDGGLATEIAVKSTNPSATVRAGAIRWPRPSSHKSPDGASFGYDGAVALFMPLEVTGTAEPTELEVTTRFLVCRDLCVMGTTTHRVTLSREKPTVSSATMDIVKRDLARLPQRTEAAIEGSTLVLRGTLPANASAAPTIVFFPHDTPGVTYGAVKHSVSNGAFRIEVPFTVNERNALGKPLRAGGVVAFDGADGPSLEASVPVAAP